MVRSTHIDALIALLLCALAPGCTLLNDPWSLGGGPRDAGVAPRDAMPDAQISPDGPSAPVVAITPAQPTTRDVLTLEITQPSVDPLGGSVRYQVVWTRDGDVVPDLTDTVAPSSTASGERWAVEVIPFATTEGPERRGVAGGASVTIANTAPIVRSVGLSRYDPIVGEELRAFVGRVVDPDDADVPARIYRWRVDGEVLAGATTDRISLAGVSAGAEITVEVFANDGTMDGPSVTAGPATVLSDEMRWRQAWPNRDGRIPWRAYDPLHHRLLFLDAPLGTSEGDPDNRITLWEYALDGLASRFVQLPLSGDAPTIRELSFGTPKSFYDASEQRLLVVCGAHQDGPSSGMRVYDLDLSQRGNERWRRLVVTGESPASRLNGTMQWLPSQQAVLIGGGFDLASLTSGGGLVPRTDVALLDLSGTPTWRTVSETGYPLGVVFPAVIDDPARQRALLVGGVIQDDFAGGVGEPSPNTYALDLTAPTAGFTVVADEVSESTLDGLTWADPDDPDHLSLVGFRLVGGEPEFRLYHLELATLTWTGLGDTVLPFDVDGGFPRLGVHLDDERLTHFSSGGPLVINTFDPSTAAITSVYAYGETGPPSLAGALAVASSSFVGPTDVALFGGFGDASPSGDPPPGARGGMWRAFELGNPMRFPAYEPMADPVDGAPAPRHSVVTNTSGRYADLTFFSGAGDGTPVSEAVVWTFTGSQWVAQELVGGSLEPVEGGLLVRGDACFGTPNTIVFGGRRANGTYAGTTVALECNDISCTVSPATAGAEPTARAFMGVSLSTQDPRTGIMFGGLSQSGPLADLQLAALCTVGESWTPATPAGVGPSPRYGHSFTSIDTIHELMVFGGNVQTPSARVASNELFRLREPDLGIYEWVPVTPRGVPPIARLDHAAVYDREGRRLVIYGGSGGVYDGELMGDLWELHLPAVPAP